MAEIGWWLAGINHEPGAAMWSRPQCWAKVTRGASRAAPAAVVLQPYAAKVPGELIRTTNGKWITKPPSRCPNGHPLCPGQVLVGHVACLGHGSARTRNVALPNLRRRAPLGPGHPLRMVGAVHCVSRTGLVAHRRDDGVDQTYPIHQPTTTNLMTGYD